MAKNSKDIRPQSAPQGGKAKNKKKKKKHTKLFVVFTFATPEIELFKDPLTNTYGI